jgi:hypothetical protein
MPPKIISRYNNNMMTIGTGRLRSDICLQVGPYLVGHGFAIPIFKVMGVEPALKEKAYSSVE